MPGWTRYAGPVSEAERGSCVSSRTSSTFLCRMTPADCELVFTASGQTSSMNDALARCFSSQASRQPASSSVS
jgi:hypothetical protein